MNPQTNGANTPVGASAQIIGDGPDPKDQAVLQMLEKIGQMVEQMKSLLQADESSQPGTPMKGMTLSNLVSTQKGMAQMGK